MKSKSTKDVSSLQRLRQQRGEDFQDEIRRSWRLIENCWRMRIADGKGGTRPADEIIILENVNVLMEAKRTQGTQFKLNMLRENQITGLIDFDRVVSRNYGLVFISFLDDKTQLDEAYAIRLVTALKYMKNANKLNISLPELRNNAVANVKLPLIEAAERTYDLKGVVNCYKLL